MPRPKPVCSPHPYLKRCCDLLLASIALLACAPLMLCIYGLIRCCGFNQPIFTQKRVGQNGKIFTIFKFRTLRARPHQSPDFSPDHGSKSILSLLRCSGFDELPQLFNILRGDMSLVGPRPHTISDHILFASMLPEYEDRLAVKPGLTGWAQIRGWRGPVTCQRHLAERVAHDLAYISKQHFFFDLAILVGTVLLPLTASTRRSGLLQTKDVT
ncbi:sugar transferase [Thalassospira lucentensis]|uniref:sugar transferase n=1 Tax=Thalassospira lucentensis TaxID=168935 RepID=UPI003D29FAF6